MVNMDPAADSTAQRVVPMLFQAATRPRDIVCVVMATQVQCVIDLAHKGHMAKIALFLAGWCLDVYL